MSDASNIFNLYLESKEQPKLTVDEDGNKSWRLHGKLHRDNAPAIEYFDGTKSWWLHGKRHRYNAPAIEHADGTKSWWMHGNLHRDNGPAHENPRIGYKEWWLHGKHYKTPEAWAQALLKLRNKPHDADAINEFLLPILSKYIA